MNELLLVATLTILFGALPLIFVGYQIAFNNKNHWINGVDQSKLSNPNGFVKYIGNSIITTGILVIVVCALLYFQAINYIGFALALTCVSMLPLPCFVLAKSKYA